MASSSAAEIMAEIMVGVELQREEIRPELHIFADEVADYARSIAPVYHGPFHEGVVSGEFRDSIQVEDAPDHDGMPAVQVSSYSPIAHLLEFGTVKMHEFGTFANTAAHFGGTGPDRVEEP